MENKRTKLWRRRHEWRLYKKKMMLFASYSWPMRNSDGVLIENPRWVDFVGARGYFCYKSMRTPCSCDICRGEKYSRNDYKSETRRIIKETMG